MTARDQEFQERLEQLDAQHRSVRRVFASFLFLIAVAVISALAFGMGSVVLRPKPHSEREPGGIRNVRVPSASSPLACGRPLESPSFTAGTGSLKESHAPE